jgi:hypothetical protein
MKRNDLQSLYLRMLVYGLGGSGKTGFAGTWDTDRRTARCFYINAAGNPVRLRHQTPAPYVFDVETLNDLGGCWDFLRDQRPDNKFREKYSIPPDVVFQSVVIDTITEIQRIIIAELAGRPYIASCVPMRTRVDMNDAHVTNPGEWGVILQRTINVVNLFYQLPMHVLLTSQERGDFDDAGKLVRYSPALQGQSSEQVPSYAEIVGRMVRRARRPDDNALVAVESTSGDSVGVLQLAQAGKTSAKNQVDVRIPKEVADPTITKILDIILTPHSAGAPRQQPQLTRAMRSPVAPPQRR